jgi:hypothetical protein
MIFTPSIVSRTTSFPEIMNQINNIFFFNSLLRFPERVRKFKEFFETARFLDNYFIPLCHKNQFISLFEPAFTTYIGRDCDLTSRTDCCHVCCKHKKSKIYLVFNTFVLFHVNLLNNQFLD